MTPVVSLGLKALAGLLQRHSSGEMLTVTHCGLINGLYLSHKSFCYDGLVNQQVLWMELGEQVWIYCGFSLVNDKL